MPPLLRPLLPCTRPLHRALNPHPQLSHLITFLQSQSTSTGTHCAKPPCSNSKSTSTPSAPSPPLISAEFWSSRPTWRRATLNTLRCLAGCTAGDFGALWYMQCVYPEVLSVGVMMGVAMTSGLLTSLSLETLLLRFGRDGLPWTQATQTALGMSFLSMAAMEGVENAVELHLTGGVVAFDEWRWWGAGFVSVCAGFMAPLPWNYARLRRWGRGCH